MPATVLTPTRQLEVVNHVLVEMPVACNKPGANTWVAKIAHHPDAVGKLQREFIARAGSPGCFLLHGITVGTPLEFAAEIKGKPHRYYAVVEEIADDHITVCKYCSGPSAISAAGLMYSDYDPEPEFLEKLTDLLSTAPHSLTTMVDQIQTIIERHKPCVK